MTAYSSKEIAKTIAKVKSDGWNELPMEGFGVQDTDLRMLLDEPGVDRLHLLNLSACQLSALPPEIGRLTALTALDLSRNKLSALPPEIGQLTELAQVHLYKNRLSALPPTFGRLTALEVLLLSHNEFPTLPPEIGNLTALCILFLRGNRLSTLPPEIGCLTALTTLDLSGNKLLTLPPEIGRLNAVTSLHLNENQLSTLPPEIRQLTGLTDLYLHGNDGLGIPPEILGPTSNEVHSAESKRPANPSAILDYYFRTRREVTRALNEVKVLLVGEAQVGKTSLVKAIIYKKACVAGERMTEGISIDRWDVEGKRAGEKVRLNIWDFGGQEIMHATHQFFLTKRSLYLLVLDARQDEKQCRLEYWLRLVQSCGGDSPVVVVVNKIDDGRLKLDRNGLILKYAPNLKGFVETSCESLDGIAELRERIAREVNALEHVDSRLPVSYFAVKEDLEAKAGRTPHMRWDEYTGVCAKQGVTGGEDQERLAQFLHDLGVILSFRDGPLAGLGVLSPRWVTSGVYAIITSERLNQAGGVLRRDCLEQVLRPDEYPPDKRNFIIEMMKKFELCFAFHEGGDERWLIPGLLDKERPEIEWDEAEAVRFEYRYAVLPGSVIWRFIVRNHTMLDKQKPVYWRSGVVLHIDGAEALMVADEEGKRLSISVRGPSPVLRRSALTHIRMELEHIHSNLHRIDAKGKVPLPDQLDVAVDYHHLLKLEELGELEFLPEGADHKYRVAELLEGVSGKGQRVRERQRCQDAKDWSRTERNEVFISYSHKDKKWLDALKTTLAPLTRDKTLHLWDDSRIRPGDKWRDEIRLALERAKIGVLLVTPEFLASDFIAKNELPPLLDAAENEGLTLFWIPLKHSLYNYTPINDYQAAWPPDKPLDILGKGQAKALAQIGEQLKKAYDTP